MVSSDPDSIKCPWLCSQGWEVSPQTVLMLSKVLEAWLSWPQRNREIWVTRERPLSIKCLPLSWPGAGASEEVPGISPPNNI